VTTRAVSFFAEGPDGAALTGLSPAWVYLRRDDGTDLTGSIAAPSQVDASTHPGEYRATLTLDAGQWLTGRVDFGSTADPRFASFAVTEQDLRDLSEPPTAAAIAAEVDAPTAAAIAAEVDATLTPPPTVEAIAAEVATVLADEHGAGPWVTGGAGSGTEEVSLQVRADGVPVQGAKVTVLNAGIVQVAQAASGSDGVAVVMLDAGSYFARVSLAGYQWPAFAIVVEAGGAVTPATLDGEELPDRLRAREGIAGTCSIVAPALGRITGFSTGDALTLTRACAGVPSGATVTAAALRWGLPGERTGWGEVVGTVTDAGAGGVAAFAFALTSATTHAMRKGPCHYEVRVTLSTGATVVVESGDLAVRRSIP